MTLSSMTLNHLFSFLPSIVAASSGAVVADILHSTHQVEITITVSYVCWSAGLLPAIALIIIYMQRMAEHKIPPREQIFSLFLPVGPFGLGAFGY
jgi:tellurite resistance protein TehA-like permease